MRRSSHVKLGGDEAALFEPVLLGCNAWFLALEPRIEV